ncbi:hypothetical protein SLEP1_g39915 [Rubroshorea leprosula]|uniref:Uncharacterized protein n=1 Tax=Rubroshorea leprosula TaxID=152421 RepID=A0AAV5L2F4_9ROSI|nr:hypothetical protein SLEP1_g39915 [Rubroshorea leprosula]
MKSRASLVVNQTGKKAPPERRRRRRKKKEEERGRGREEYLEELKSGDRQSSSDNRTVISFVE